MTGVSTTVGPSHTTRLASELVTRNAVTAAMPADLHLDQVGDGAAPEPRCRSAEADHVEGGEAGGDPVRFRY